MIRKLIINRLVILAEQYVKIQQEANQWIAQYPDAEKTILYRAMRLRIAWIHLKMDFWLGVLE